MTGAQAPETLLAFDFGLRRTGVALGNGITRTARPLTVIDSASEAARFESIGRLIGQWQPQRLVVGVPREPDARPAAHASATSAADTLPVDGSPPAQGASDPAAPGARGTLLMTERCARFARQLSGRFGLPVVTVDERFTSRAAAGDAGRGPDDAHAAALILEQWFHDGA